MNDIMSGQATSAQMGAYLAVLSAKGETIGEITGSAAAMREKALSVNHGLSNVFEIVGTGGDGAKTFNISTTSSFVIAASGVKVAKHGNRAASSACGAADCLEALGANIRLSPEACVKLLKENGICFLFAQTYHSSMVFMTYANVVFSYGSDRFLRNASEAGMNGIILPDVPFEEKDEFAPLCRKHGKQGKSYFLPGRLQPVSS